MSGTFSITKLFSIVSRNRTAMTMMAAGLLLLSQLNILQAQTSVRSQSISAVSNASPTKMAASASIVQTNLPLVLHTNAASELLVDFGMLAGYPMKVPDNLIINSNQPAWADGQVNAMIPPSIKGLDGKKIRVEGFMLPTIWDGKTGKVREFLLLANQVSCCYGGPTQVHEFITIHLKGKGVDAQMDETIPVAGILRVGAMRENAQLVGIYQLETEGLAPPPSK